MVLDGTPRHQRQHQVQYKISSLSIEMPRKSSRSSRGLLERLYTPLNQLLKVSGNSVRTVSSGVGRVASNVLTTGNKVGKRMVKGVDNTVKGVTMRKSRRSGRKANTRRNNMRRR